MVGKRELNNASKSTLQGILGKMVGKPKATTTTKHNIKMVVAKWLMEGTRFLLWLKQRS